MKVNLKICAIILAIVIVILSFLGIILMAVGANDSQVINVEANNRYTIAAVTFDESDLVYDTTTKIVYINSNNVYTPYLSPNGLPYRYVDGRLVEVIR